MGENKRQGGLPARARPRADAWQVAWHLLLPLAWVLLTTTTATVLVAHNATSMTAPDGSLAGLARWLWGFTSLRFAVALLAGYLLQRRLWPRSRFALVATACLGALLMWALGAAVAFSRREPVSELLGRWWVTAADQARLLVACTWFDAITLAAMVLLLGIVLRLCPNGLRPMLVRAVQLASVALSVLVAVAYAVEWSTGQPVNTRVLIFALVHAGDTARLVQAELTPYLAGVLAMSLAFAAAWQWHVRGLANARLAWEPRSFALALALLGTAGWWLPAPAVGMAELERASGGTLLTLARTVRPFPLDEVRRQVLHDVAAEGRAPWFSDTLQLSPIDPQAPRRNVVIVMLESMRAASTTLATPPLPTTPFLKSLADQGLRVADMNAVIPRTAAAWTAILGGTYPLTNEGTGRWAARQEDGAPASVALPRALRSLGYATSFFTPAEVDFLHDRQVIERLGFEEVFAESEVNRHGAPRVNYFGPPDEVMLEPIAEWTQAQVQAGRPFMTAIMTNVGHHPYGTPPGWQRVDFKGVPPGSTLDRYYNGLRYVDGILAQLMARYRQLGVLDNTVFVFIGDHGQLFGEHGLRQSFNAIYQPGVQVPAVVYAPGIIRASRVAQGPRQQVDILPTVVDLLGLRMAGARLPGRSLLQPADHERTLFFSSSIDWTQLAMRRGQRKYIYAFDRRPMRVYDLATDPHELHPLKGVEAIETDTARRAMLAWKAKAELAALGQAK